MKFTAIFLTHEKTVTQISSFEAAIFKYLVVGIRIEGKILWWVK